MVPESQARLSQGTAVHAISEKWGCEQQQCAAVLSVELPAVVFHDDAENDLLQLCGFDAECRRIVGNLDGIERVMPVLNLAHDSALKVHALGHLALFQAMRFPQLGEFSSKLGVEVKQPLFSYQ